MFFMFFICFRWVFFLECDFDWVWGGVVENGKGVFIYYVFKGYSYI